MSFQGNPCWFELSVARPEAAQGFYAALLGWEWSAVDMGAFDYHLARSGAGVVAGALALAECPEGTPPNWMIYIAVDDCDASAAEAAALGGKVWKVPADIPGTGRFAVLADPQGAVFGILQPLPMDPPPESGAFDQQKPGHGNWVELMSRDPVAGMAFYSKLFGWHEDTVMPMGEMGGYHLFSRNGAQIGGMMGLGQAPVPNWMPYFGVENVAAAIATTTAKGGTVLHGPAEVPGPALIAALRDPQGAHFAVVGPKP